MDPNLNRSLRSRLISFFHVLLKKMKYSLNSHTLDPALQMFLNGVKEFRKEIISIYLFGSRARQTYRPDSDYDLLVIAKDKTKKDKLYDLAVDIFCKTGADISLKIFKKEDFEKLKILATPFIENVLKEGRRIA